MPAKRTAVRLKRRRARVVIGFPAFLDTDADIIAWWDGLEPGHGAQILRELIRRAALDRPEVDLTTVLLEMAAMREEMHADHKDLREALAAATFIQVGEAESDAETLSDDDVTRRKKAILERGW